MKIAIIEDRISRLEQYTNFDLKNYKSIKIITGTDFDVLISNLKNSNTEALDQFDCVASHRSALSNEVRDVIKEFCRKKRKPLVFFSGGITSSVMKDKEFPFLHINSKDFYSENLKMFIEEFEVNHSVNLLILQFGKNWKLNLLLNLRNNIAIYLNKMALINELKDIEFESSELIKRVRDLQINSALKEDLMHKKTADILLADDLAPVSFAQVQNLKHVLDIVINEMV